MVRESIWVEGKDVNVTRGQSVGLVPGLWVPSAFVELKEEGQLNHTFPLKFFYLSELILLRGEGYDREGAMSYGLGQQLF